MNSNIRRVLMLLGLAIFLSGCAVLRGPGAGQKLDPWESWNRKVFSFNESLDKNLLKPVATAYSEVVPSQVRRGFDNFFGNIGDAWSAFNLVLQGRFKQAVQQTMRFAVNSTFGLVGVLDVSTEVGLERNTEDLGMTFGRWGFGTGAYIVWPLFGPSSVRDTLAKYTFFRDAYLQRRRSIERDDDFEVLVPASAASAASAPAPAASVASAP